MGRLPMNGFDLNKLIICSSHIIRHDPWNITKKNIWIWICSPVLPFLPGVKLLAIALCSGFKMNPLRRQMPDSRCIIWQSMLTEDWSWAARDLKVGAIQFAWLEKPCFCAHANGRLKTADWRLETEDCQLIMSGPRLESRGNSICMASRTMFLRSCKRKVEDCWLPTAYWRLTTHYSTSSL